MGAKKTAAHKEALRAAFNARIASMTPAQRLAYRVNCSKRAKANWGNPKTRDKIIAGMRRAHAERKAERSAKCLAAREARSARTKRQWADPATRAQMINGMRAVKGVLAPVDAAPRPILRRIIDKFTQAIGL